MRSAIIILCIALFLIALWLMQAALPPNPKPDLTSKPAETPSMSVSAPSAPEAGKPPAVRKPLKIDSKGRVRLKPGESAVLGYWEIAPGMNGMAIVTPETTPEGHVKMTAKLLHLSDDAVSATELDDLFFNLNDFENYSAIDPERLRGLQDALQSTRGVDMLSMPTLLSHPGQRAMISIGDSNESTLSLSLQADPVADDGGYDLSLELQREER